MTVKVCWSMNMKTILKLGVENKDSWFSIILKEYR